jgi:hypothetical protein
VTVEVTVHGAGLPAGTTRSAPFYYQTEPCTQPEKPCRGSRPPRLWGLIDRLGTQRGI